MNEYKKSNLEIVLTTALSNALVDLDPLKNNYSNKYLIVEIRILQWMLDIVPKLHQDLKFLKEVVNKEIDNFKVKYYYAQDINEIDNVDKLSKSIKILQTCLFLISRELEFNDFSLKGYNRK